MDFAVLQALDLPEGRVKQIAVNGVVIWQQPDPS